MPPRRTMWFLALAWICAAVGLGSVGAIRNGTRTPVEALPLDLAQLPRGAGGTVAVCVHPSCRCTGRSLDLLAALIDARPDLAVTVLLAVPADDSCDLPWVDADLCRGGRFHLRLDVGGRFASELGATRSGHAVVTDGSGRVVFSGGVVTGGHEHRMDAAGRTSFLARWDELLSAPAPTRAPVDGCSLVHETSGVER